ncbi:MAG TPA: MoxR family ATPase [Firmicutes bacterium]|nr:MoxR family ATPase [Bacillota bacterium]
MNNFWGEFLRLNFTLCRKIMQNVSRVMVGKSRSLELLLTALLAEGHVLLEDVPGVGKTQMAKSLAKSIGGTFKRVQFTPDLLPADITGFNIYDQQTGRFKFQPGPLMANVVLADEINRTIPRTQASLLESMEERQLTVDGVTMPLPSPFFVLATQNPIELEGTFPLPEAQLDRFLLCVDLGYPSRDEEILILERFQEEDPILNLETVVSPGDILQLQMARRKILVSPEVREYIVDLVAATRQNKYLSFGASPRSSIHLMRAAQALALLRERSYVLPDDVKYLLKPVLAHRLILQTEERIRGVETATILEEIAGKVPVPTSLDEDR